MEVSVVCLFRSKMKHSLRVQIFQSMSLIDEDELKRHLGVSESHLDWFVPCNPHLPPVSTQELLVLDDHLVGRDDLMRDTFISFGEGCRDLSARLTTGKTGMVPVPPGIGFFLLTRMERSSSLIFSSLNLARSGGVP